MRCALLTDRSAGCSTLRWIAVVRAAGLHDGATPRRSTTGCRSARPTDGCGTGSRKGIFALSQSDAVPREFGHGSALLNPDRERPVAAARHVLQLGVSSRPDCASAI